MKKPTLSIAVLAIVFISLISFSAFKSKNPTLPSKARAAVVSTLPEEPCQSCPTSCSCVLNDGTCNGSCSPTPTPVTWKVPNYSWTKSGSTVSFSSLAICYFPSSTPPWSSSNQIGTMYNYMGTVLVPSSTKVFNATASNGATFQCTLYSSGAFYIQQTAGTAPGKGTTLSGSYTL